MSPRCKAPLARAIYLTLDAFRFHGDDSLTFGEMVYELGVLVTTPVLVVLLVVALRLMQVLP